HLLPDIERICDKAMIMHKGTVKFVGTIDELRGARGHDNELHVAVRGDAGKLAAALTAAGATCKGTTPVQLEGDLAASATTRAVVERAKQIGVQVRGVEVRRESVEAGFMRVLGEQERT